MFIQHRHSFKENWADMWDMSAGGSILAGETSAMAMKRELYEEHGIEIIFEDQRPFLTIHFDEGFDDIYLINEEVDISMLKLQSDEVQAVKWASLNEIIQVIDNNLFVPYHKSLIELLFMIKDKRSAQR